jgi:hypothetical protein
MNNGFFGFPSSTDTNIVSVKEYDTSGTYAIPSNAKRIMIFAVGGGGGGGGGVRRVATNGSPGGVGGNAGCYVLTELPIKAFANIKTLSIIIGAGGVGGIGATADSTSPAASTPGGNTEVWVPGKNAPLLMAGGNVGGGGGIGTGLNSNPASASSAGISILFGHPFRVMSSDALEINRLAVTVDSGGARGGSSSGITGGSVRLVSCFECGGGGGGGTVSNTVANSGGSITAIKTADLAGFVSGGYSTFTSTNFAAGSTFCAGGPPNGGTAGESGNSLINSDAMFSAGLGGAGGGGGATGAGNAAGNGGNGYRGGGGGGGGGSVNGVSAGNGGNGGNGYVKIVAIG